MASDTYLRPVDALEILDITVEDLVQATNLNPGAVVRAILGGPHMIHYTVAEAIADQLGVKVDELAWPREITDLGRPAHTGRPLRHGRFSNQFCETCHLEFPLSMEHVCA